MPERQRGLDLSNTHIKTESLLVCAVDVNCHSKVASLGAQLVLAWEREKCKNGEEKGEAPQATNTNLHKVFDLEPAPDQLRLDYGFDSAADQVSPTEARKIARVNGLAKVLKVVLQMKPQ